MNARRFPIEDFGGFNARKYRGLVTDGLLLWIGHEGSGEPAPAEARSIARAAANIDDASEELESWFEERLTVDPGIPGPFGALGVQLLAVGFEFVDWHRVAESLRHLDAELN